MTSKNNNEESFRHIFNNSPIGIYQTTPDGKILIANPALLKMLGYDSFDKLASRNLEKEGYVNKNETRKEFKEKLEQSGELVGYENSWLREDGKIIYIRENARVIKKDDGSIVYEGTVEDITDKKLAEIALRESEERFSILFNGNPDPILLINPESGIVIDANNSACRLLKYDKSQLKNIYIIDLIQSDNKKISLNTLINLAKLADSGEKIIPYNGYLIRSSGIEIPVEILMQMIKIQGKKILFGVFRDITERKRVEKQLKELNESKDKFFSIIAHDLKSPFTSLLGLSEFLLNDYESLTSEDIRNFSENIYKSAKGVFNLLENLLQWSRFQTGRMEFLPTNFNVNELLEQTISLYKVNIVKKNISIKYFADKEVNVFADKFMIDTVIRNLVSNAIKFTPNNGEIELSAKFEGRFALIEISDNGVGISKENIKKIFTLGERITTLGTDKEKGTGLGLILCKEFIEKNNGDITVQSILGQGTKFTILLPS